MDVSEIKLVIEAALLAAGRPLPFEKLVELFARRGDAPDRATIREALDALAADYAERGIELKEVGSGFRIQVRSTMAEWLQPLWEERAPRYTRALLETLALIAYRQPITRSEIEEVRGVAVSSNIVRTLMERGWVRVVGHREVPGKPAMLGTTREFLDYFGLKKLEDLPALTEFNEDHPQMSPQGDFLEPYDDWEGEDGQDTAAPLAAVPGGVEADELDIVASAELASDEAAASTSAQAADIAAEDAEASDGTAAAFADPDVDVPDDSATAFDAGPSAAAHAPPEEEGGTPDPDDEASAQASSGQDDDTPDDAQTVPPAIRQSESGGL